MDNSHDSNEPVAEVAGRAGDLHIRFLPSGHSLQLGDKLYTSPPASKPWAGLEPQDFKGMDMSDAFEAGAYWANNILREKNQ